MGKIYINIRDFYIMTSTHFPNMKFETFYQSFFLVFLTSHKICGAVDLLDGCSFNTLTLITPSSGFNIPVSNACGILLRKESFQKQPFVAYENALMDRKYTLLMMDKNGPGAQYGKYYLHWMVVDIPVSC